MIHLTNLLIVSSLSVASASIPTLRGSMRENNEQRVLQTDGSFQGSCTVSNFVAAVGSSAELASLLQVNNDEGSLQDALDAKCNAALAVLPGGDLSVVVGKGPQFLKNFLDGGTNWNENSGVEGTWVQDKDDILAVYDTTVRSTVLSTPNQGADDAYPGYFSNFYNGDLECRMGVITCCYTGTRDEHVFEPNSQMCAHDMTLAAKSNHIQHKSYSIFKNSDVNTAYCSSFAWEENSFADSVKYNTLFHLAMKSNLSEKGYVRNVPGAPMCGCLEQMPVITNSACTSVVEGYKIDKATGEVTVNLNWEDCGDLLTHYTGLEGRGEMEKFFVGEKIVGDNNCDSAATKFLNEHMMVHA